MRITILAALCAAVGGCGNVESPGTVVDSGVAEPDGDVPDGPDGDEDTIADAEDNCPAVANPGQENGDPQPTASATPIPIAMRETPAEVAVTGDDAVSDAIPIGFPFTFFGRTYDQVFVTTDGALMLGPNPVNPVLYQVATAIPDRHWPNALVAGYWADLDQDSGGTIVWGLQGEAPERELVVEWSGVPHFDRDGEFPVTMQIVLLESGSAVEVHCLACPSDGTAHTQGVEDQLGLFGASLNGRSLRNFQATDDAVRFETSLGEPDASGDVCDYCPALWTAEDVDSDGDTIGDACDNCPDLANPQQVDTDADGIGNDCDTCPDSYDDHNTDDDVDQIGDACDNCSKEANADQADRDEDFVGDVCDNCPDDPNEDQADADGDGIGDVCDPETTLAPLLAPPLPPPAPRSR
ncbi:MAG TPA: thrombospondin type 3 repeat-containing protein [Kofleriaceae bacterium]|nr:thrombospondin type 3 repeat-containing protein [Kofleriaceae bacterium]